MNKVIDDRVIKVHEYYQLKNKPGKRQLDRYYKKIYYQETKGSYQKSYTPDELKWIENNLKIIQTTLKSIVGKNLKGKTFLDIGSGEGWALHQFHKIGCNVLGIDLSSYGIIRFNRPMLKYFQQCNLDDFLRDAVKNKNIYDLINLTNVIEHVLEPEKLLTSIKKILNPGGVVIVTFPNDFSPLHLLLTSKKKIKEPFWIAEPDHISYFNKSSFDSVAKRLGYNPVFFLADFPIDLFLLNDHSNYALDKQKGKEAHNSRVNFINLISKLSVKNAAELLHKLGSIGLGRNLTAFLQRAE